MHVKGFLHKLLTGVMHQKRLSTLILVVTGAILTKKISVTNLGRGIAGNMQERSAIRQADRLIGNENLHSERKRIYCQTIHLIVGKKNRIQIIVDWSQVPNTKYHFLRAAAVVATGRTLTLYEEVHPEKKLGNSKIQNKFLQTLAKLLPTGCQAVVITDAGFHSPWFEQVVAQGWDYVGRIRGTYKYRKDAEKGWKICSNLLKKATGVEQSMGKVWLGKKRAITTYLYLSQEPLKGRKAKARVKREGNNVSQKCRRGAQEAWLLASSLGGKSYLCAKRVIKLYQTRMQIEEGFRDLKSSRYGLSFEQAYSRSITRIENLLLVAVLASLIAWLVGWIGEQEELQLKFQSNSVKNKRVISLFFLGCQIIKRKIEININQLLSIINKGINYA